MEELRMEIAEFLAEWYCPDCYEEISGDIKVNEQEVQIPEEYIEDACTSEDMLPPSYDPEVKHVTNEEVYEFYKGYTKEELDSDITFFKRQLVCMRAFDSNMEEILSRYGYDYVGRIWTDGYYIIKKKEK